MANNPMGLDFIEGSLGVVVLNFDGVDLGKTIGEASLEAPKDVKDILYAQNGTQPDDKVITGQAWLVKCKLGELTWARLNKIMQGLTIVGHNAKFGSDLYRSGKTNFAKVLTVTRVDSEGDASTDPHYKATFYKAYPTATGAIGSFGPDNQRELEVEFYCFRDSTHDNAFGYAGYPSSLGL